MARIRTIKPEFWRHEDLSALPEATHLLAAALLNYADDCGYFNANPKLVQAECSPLREPSVSIPESFRSLQTMGYIELGSGPDGKRYGRIMHFADHQRVSHPTASKLASISIAWDDNLYIPENFGKAPENFVPEQGTGNREQGKEKKEGFADANLDLTPLDELEAAFSAWNTNAEQHGLSKAQKFDPRRKAQTRARLKECGGLAGWDCALAKVAASPFLLGKNDRGFRADFDFFITTKNFTKLMEGGFDPGVGSPGSRSMNDAFDELEAQQRGDTIQ